MSKIRILTGPLRGREKTLGDKALTIGRDVEAGIQILDRSASRFHAELFPVGGMWFARDLDSKNGTYVNDEKLKDEELLRVGDVVKIGSTELVYEVGAAISDDDSSNRIAYNDDPDMMSNTLEFRLDELSDISEPAESGPEKDNAKGLRILYQIGRILSDPGAGTEPAARVMDCLIAAMPAESALIFRRDTATGKLMPSVVRTAAAHIQPIISRSIIKKTFTENKALHSANAQEDDRFARNASISLKGIRSVVSVPLAVGGQVRGVVYLSRGTGSVGGPAGMVAFDQFDLELVSAVSIQIGLAQAAADERRRHKDATRHLLITMIRALETRTMEVGVGERCGKACAALGRAMHLDASVGQRLYLAGLLHHLGRLMAEDSGTGSYVKLEGIPELESVLPLIRQARERLDGSGPVHSKADDIDTETRVVTIAAMFTEAVAADPGIETTAVIEKLAADPGLDHNLVQLLLACHLDGSLYQ